MEKVDEVRDGAKDYYNIVPVPMYLDLIHSRIKNSYYIGKESILFDIELIYKNCLLYNGDNTNISKLAKKLVDDMKGLLSENKRSSRMTKSIEIPLEVHEEGKSMRTRNGRNNVNVELMEDSESDEPKHYLRNKRNRKNKYKFKY